MMWFLYALLSAALLGFYDVFKKLSLRGNAVIPVLFVNTLLCSLFFVPLIAGSLTGIITPDSRVYIPQGSLYAHKYVVLKAMIVLSSWMSGYFAIKHLPLTIVGPVNAMRPVMVLVGALLFLGERLNVWQWGGVALSIVSFLLLSGSGKREGIRFGHNRWIWLLMLSAVLGASSGLYDKFILSPCETGGIGLDELFVQGWYNIYQTLFMLVVLVLVWWPVRRRSTPFRLHWAIPLISIFLTAADLAYFYALSQPEALVAIVSMVRRASVIVSFGFGALVLREKNIRAKAFDLFLVLLGLLLLCVGTF